MMVISVEWEPISNLSGSGDAANLVVRCQGKGDAHVAAGVLILRGVIDCEVRCDKSGQWCVVWFPALVLSVNDAPEQWPTLLAMVRDALGFTA